MTDIPLRILGKHQQSSEEQRVNGGAYSQLPTSSSGTDSGAFDSQRTAISNQRAVMPSAVRAAASSLLSRKARGKLPATSVVRGYSDDPEEEQTLLDGHEHEYEHDELEEAGSKHRHEASRVSEVLTPGNLLPD